MRDSAFTRRKTSINFARVFFGNMSAFFVCRHFLYKTNFKYKSFTIKKIMTMKVKKKQLTLYSSLYKLPTHKCSKYFK